MKSLPEQFKDLTNITVLVESYAKQLDEVEVMFRELLELRSFESSEGRQLDGLGDIEVLSRAKSALYAGIIDFDVIDDDRYRLFLKYKALRNSNQCTFPELVAACKLLYNAETVYFREDEAYPATFFLNIGAKFNDDILRLLQSSQLTIRPGGVKVNVGYFNMEFFGFSDTNRFALGFGMAPFAQQIVTEQEEVK